MPQSQLPSLAQEGFQAVSQSTVKVVWKLLEVAFADCEELMVELKNVGQAVLDGHAVVSARDAYIALGSDAEARLGTRLTSRSKAPNSWHTWQL